MMDVDKGIPIDLDEVYSKNFFQRRDFLLDLVLSFFDMCNRLFFLDRNIGNLIKVKRDDILLQISEKVLCLNCLFLSEIFDFVDQGCSFLRIGTDFFFIRDDEFECHLRFPPFESEYALFSLVSHKKKVNGCFLRVNGIKANSLSRLILKLRVHNQKIKILSC